MEVNDGRNEWDAIMSANEKEDEIRRLTVGHTRKSATSCTTLLALFQQCTRLIFGKVGAEVRAQGILIHAGGREFVRA